MARGVTRSTLLRLIGGTQATERTGASLRLCGVERGGAALGAVGHLQVRVAVVRPITSTSPARVIIGAVGSGGIVRRRIILPAQIARGRSCPGCTATGPMTTACPVLLLLVMLRLLRIVAAAISLVRARAWRVLVAGRR